MMVRSATFTEGTYWLRYVHYLGANVIPDLFLQFVCTFLDLDRKRLIQSAYGLAILLQILSFVGLEASIAPLPPFNFYTIPLPCYLIFVLYFFIYSSYPHWLLWKKMRSPTASDHIKNQIKYIFAGTVVGFC